MTQPASIPQSLVKFAKETPEKLCLADETIALTYAAFLRAVLGFAAHLRAEGCQPGDTVTLQAAQNVSFAVAAFGIQFAGCVCVPLDADAPTEKVEALARTVSAQYAVVTRAIACHCPQILLSSVLQLTQRETDGSETYIPDPSAVATVLFTTGTTGMPKGVMHTYASEMACGWNQVHSVQATADDVWLVPMPLSHAMGYRKLHAVVMTGATAVITKGVALAGPLFSLMERYGVTLLSLVPAYLHVLLRLWSEPLRAWNGRLRYVRLGAGAVSRGDLKQLMALLPDVSVCVSYGSTEASNCTNILFRDELPPQGCVGHANEGVEVAILGEDGVLCSTPGQTGRILLRGRHVMLGYYNDPEETHRVLQDGWLKTADIGYLDESDRLYLLGRDDEVINSGGFKIAPAQVEEAAMAVEGIADCACIPVANPILGQSPLLIAVMQPGAPFQEKQILTVLSAIMEKHLLPRSVVQAASIPRTLSGKIKRSQLIRQYAKETP